MNMWCNEILIIRSYLRDFLKHHLNHINLVMAGIQLVGECTVQGDFPSQFSWLTRRLGHQKITKTPFLWFWGLEKSEIQRPWNAASSEGPLLSRCCCCCGSWCRENGAGSFRSALSKCCYRTWGLWPSELINSRGTRVPSAHCFGDSMSLISERYQKKNCVC